MSRESFEVSSAPSIKITECLGDLLVRGSRTDRVTVRVDDGGASLDAENEGDGLTFSAPGDCTVDCPSQTRLTVSDVRADVKIRNVRGQIVLGQISGDVALRAVGPATLTGIAGDLSVRGVLGDLRAESVAADARLRDVEGVVSLEQVGGDLNCAGLRHGLSAEQVGADVRLGPPFAPGATYRVRAGGSLRLAVPIDASLHLSLRAGGRIRSRLPNLSLEETDTGQQGTIGAGEANLDADVGGSIRIRVAEAERDGAIGYGPDLDGLGAQIEAQIADSMADVEARLGESLSRIDSGETWRRYEREAERVRHMAGQHAEREGRRAQRSAEQARLRAERAERRWRRASGRPVGPEPQAVSDAERLQILRMVEAGKVSPAQAADLLAALEGR